MSDKISKEQRSRNMSRIRGKDTKPEKLVRSYLFKKGYRFRKNDKRYPGTPDIVLPKYNTIIFINGCFWHQHSNCKYARLPKSNVDFWTEKFERNKLNDNLHKLQLENMDWKVLTIWECEVRDHFEATMNRLDAYLKASIKSTEQ